MPRTAHMSVLHPRQEEADTNFFHTPIEGNSIKDYGTVSLDDSPLRLKVALAKIEGGAIFPWQYHRGGTEIALILAGEGVIEVGEDESVQETVSFAAGDIVSIPENVLYRVRNIHPIEPLQAWVFFSETCQSYWPDGSPA